MKFKIFKVCINISINIIRSYVLLTKFLPINIVYRIILKIFGSLSNFFLQLPLKGTVA